MRGISGKIPDPARGVLMFRRTASRVAVVSAVMLVAGGAIAAPAMADGGQVGPKQYFYGEVFGLASSTAQDVIQVSCVGPETTGHPVADQYVAAHQFFPPVTTSYGYTGNSGTEIDVNLIYSVGTITVATPTFATLTYYDTKAEIPPSLTVPCSGTGVVVFTPYPDSGGSGIASDVDVTFESSGA
jgi:hypothetical protein